MVAHHSALCNKLVEFLNGAVAASCGTIWGSLPCFGVKASDSSIELDFPLLGRTGLLRCFSLIHRCSTPSPSARADLRSSEFEFQADTVKDAIDRAVALLDSSSIFASTAATELMEGFIFVSRRLRNQFSQEVSIHAVGLLFVLARAHAALCLRNEVSEEDATMAIYLLEENFLCRTGKSILGFSPILSAKKSNLMLYTDLKDLNSHIRRLIKSHIPEI